MKKNLLGLLALSTAINFSSGFVNNEYVGTLEHKKADSSTTFGASNDINSGVFFGPKSEAFAFTGLKLEGKNLFNDAYENTAPNFYAGGSIDTNLSEKVDFSTYFFYKSDKGNEDRLKNLLEKHQDTRGTKKELDKLGYFDEKDRTLLLGLGLEERLGKTTLNQSIGFKTDDSVSTANITTKLQGVTKFNEMSTLSGYVRHDIDAKKGGEASAYGSLESEVKHTYKKDKLELTNAVKFKTPRLVQIAEPETNKESYKASTMDEDMSKLKSKHLYNFTLESNNKVVYKVSDALKTTGEVNYKVVSEKFEKTDTEKEQSLLHSPTLALELNYSKDKFGFDSKNKLNADVRVVDYKEASSNDVTKRKFEFEKYELTGLTENAFKYDKVKAIVDFKTKVDTKVKKDDSNYEGKMYNDIRAGLLFDNSKSKAGLGYSFGTNLTLNTADDGKVEAKVKEAVLDDHIFFFYTHNNFDKKVNDMLTLKGAYDLSAHGSTNFTKENYSFGFATKAMLGAEVKKGKLTFNTGLTGKHYALLTKEDVDGITKADKLKEKYAKFDENQMASVKLENELKYMFNEKVDGSAGFDVYYSYNTEKDNGMDVYREKFVPQFAWHESVRYSDLTAFATKVDKDNVASYVTTKYNFVKQAKDTVVLTPKASMTFKFMDNKLTLTPSGKLDVRFEGQRLPVYASTKAELKVNLGYNW